jgi:hypothetical protein
VLLLQSSYQHTSKFKTGDHQIPRMYPSDTRGSIVAVCGGAVYPFHRMVHVHCRQKARNFYFKHYFWTVTLASYLTTLYGACHPLFSIQFFLLEWFKLFRTGIPNFTLISLQLSKHCNHGSQDFINLKCTYRRQVASFSTGDIASRNVLFFFFKFSRSSEAVYWTGAWTF